MAFSAPTFTSLQGDYKLFSQLDPALDLPELPVLTEDSHPDDVLAHKRIADERNQKLEVARETGQVAAACKPNELPTMFTCRSIHGARLTWLTGEIRRRQLAEVEIAQLAFRMGVKSVDIPGVEFKTEAVPGHEHKLLTERSLLPIYSLGREGGEAELGPAVILDIGLQIWNRALRGVSPKS